MIKKSIIYISVLLVVFSLFPFQVSATHEKEWCYEQKLEASNDNPRTGPSTCFTTQAACFQARDAVANNPDTYGFIDNCSESDKPHATSPTTAPSPNPAPGAGGTAPATRFCFGFKDTTTDGTPTGPQKFDCRSSTYNECKSNESNIQGAGYAVTSPCAEYGMNQDPGGEVVANPDGAPPASGPGGGPTGATPNEYELLAPLPGKDKVSLAGCKDEGTGPQDCQGFIDYVKAFIKVMIGLAGVLAVLFIVIGGFQYMSSDAVFKKQEGKKKITRALWGLLLVLGSVLILQTINPNILNFGKLIQTSQQVGTEVRNTKPSPLQVGPAPTFNPGDYVRPGSGSTLPGGSGGGGGGGGSNAPVGNVPPLPPTQVGGWTDTTPSPGKKEIRVSCGEDINKAIGRATAGDRVILEGGCTWNTSLNIRKSNIMIIGGGGGARPIIRTNNEGAFIGNGVHDVAIIGIHFIGNNSKAPGINLTGNGRQNITIEDNVIQNYSKGIAANAWPKEGVPVRNLIVRRNVIVDNHGIDRPQGIYTSRVSGLLIEENVFDRNGTLCECDASTFDHNIYLQQDNAGVIVRNNIIARGASHGLQLRSGGVAENNLFLDNPINMFIDQQGSVTNNVVLGSHYFTKRGNEKVGGIGIEVIRIRAHNVTVENNIVAQKTFSEPGFFAFGFGGVSNACGGLPYSTHCDPQPLDSLPNVVFRNNIASKWPGEAFDNNPTKPTPGFVNSGNSWNGGGPSSERDIRSYIQSIGGTEGIGTFMAEARKQSRHNWRTQFTAAAVNDYIRQGFGR